MKVLKICWAILVAVHMSIIIGNALAFLFLPFLAPWYIALPCCTMIGRVLCTTVKCPLTVLENKIRKELGWPTIHRFVGHYIIRWIKK